MALSIYAACTCWGMSGQWRLGQGGPVWMDTRHVSAQVLQSTQETGRRVPGVRSAAPVRWGWGCHGSWCGWCRELDATLKPLSDQHDFNLQA